MIYTLRFSRRDVMAFDDSVISLALEEAAKKIAADYLARHGAEVLAKISPDAVASMAIAAAGAAVNETLQRKLPDKVIERRTEVHHRYRHW
jgi:hypothetical protein